MKKLWFRTLSLALAAVLVLGTAAGCAGDPGDTSGGGASKTVIIGAATDLTTLDPGKAYEVYANMITYATYDMLFRIVGDDIENPQPSLVTDGWTLDETGTVYTFPLRQDVKFTSGNPLTSKDVVWSVQRVMNLKSNTASHVAGIEKVEAPDDYTVVFTLKEKDASFLTKLASNAFCVLDSELLKQHGGTDAENASEADTAQTYLDQQSAGSGAFILKSWTKGTELVLEKNPNYWGETGNVEKVILKEIPDANTQIQMLQKGEIDIALSLNQDNVGQLDGNADINVQRALTEQMTFLIMNNDPAIGKEMSNPDVQQAVRYAIDYKGLMELCGEGASLPLSFVQQGFTGAKTRDENYQDLEKARALMEKAGYADGFTVELTAANYETAGMKWTDIAQKIKSDLAQINITVEIKTSEFAVILDPYRNGELPFLLMHWSPDYFDINNQLAFLPGDVVGERAKWSAEGHEDMIALGNQIKGESDKDKRAQYSGELQELMAENSPYAFLLQHPQVFASRTTLDNVHYNDLSKIQLAELTVK